MEAGDLIALAAMHGPDTVSYPPDGTRVVGGDAIMRSYRALLERYRVSVSVADAQWAERPPLVASWGTTTLTLHPKSGGDDVVTVTRFSDVAVADGAGWRYIVDHASIAR